MAKRKPKAETPTVADPASSPEPAPPAAPETAATASVPVAPETPLPDPARPAMPEVRPGEPPEKAARVALKKSNPSDREFMPEVLDKTVIAIPLLKILEKEKKDAGAEPSADDLVERLRGSVATTQDGTKGEADAQLPASLDEKVDLLIKLLLKEKEAAQAKAGAPTPPGGAPASEVVPGTVPTPATVLHPVIIDLNLDYPVKGRKGARDCVKRFIERVVKDSGGDPAREGVNEAKSALSEQYLFCRLSGDSIRRLVVLDADPAAEGFPVLHRRAIYHIWPDFRVKSLINKSVSTVKADAAQKSFSALGKDVVWAVIDSGVDATHPHFAKYNNIGPPPTPTTAAAPTATVPPSKDFTGVGTHPEEPFRDVFGHGTHVAGIIAGCTEASETKPVHVTSRFRDEHDNIQDETISIDAPFTGMAPLCKLVSLKVLDDVGDGEVSSIIAALEYVQEVNGYGRRMLIHGVNLSVGYDFEPEWFACGQSPLCVEVDRLVKSGVVVVVAAGNSGYGTIIPQFAGRVNMAGIELTINDPGNADLAVTVGSTHRDMPHTYGVSYFSSKGPTGDGRYKPDLVAPGEKIISCRSSVEQPAKEEKYKEESGTSMAAPHVSGVIAAFLSVRREYIGQAEEVKRIFVSTATDLNRTPYFQGKGLVDLMRAIQSV